jgi:hypothetical protein
MEAKMPDPISDRYPFIMSAINGSFTPPELTPKTQGVYVVFSGRRVLWTGLGEIQKELTVMFKSETISREHPDSFSFIECPPDTLKQEYEKWKSALKPLIDNPNRL